MLETYSSGIGHLHMAVGTTLLTAPDWRNISACDLPISMMRNIVSNESRCGKTVNPLPLMLSLEIHVVGKRNVHQLD